MAAARGSRARRRGSRSIGERLRGSRCERGRTRSSASARPRRASGARASSAGTLEERLAELLWRVALRWGEFTALASRSRANVDLRALSLLLELPRRTRSRWRWRLCATRRRACTNGTRGRCSRRRPGRRMRAGMRCVRERPTSSRSRAQAATTASRCATHLDLVLRRRDELQAARCGSAHVGRWRGRRGSPRARPATRRSPAAPRRPARSRTSRPSSAAGDRAQRRRLG